MTNQGKIPRSRPPESKEIREEITRQTHQNLETLQEEIIRELAKAKSAEERVRMYGEIVDDYGLDAIISLLPLEGDLASSLVSTLYLIFEARNANLGKSDYIKIIGMQTADAFVGMIPVAGDILDYFFKANKWSSDYFSKQTKKLENRARELGVPEEKITQIHENAKNLPQIARKITDFLHSPNPGA